MSFAGSEAEHAEKYRTQGFSVICHPWPTVAPIPWPPVVRQGIQHGRGILPVKPFLLQPLSAGDISELKKANWTWLEDKCIPWGWTCWTPMWTSYPTADYWAARRQDALKRGLIHSRPRWEKRGLDKKHHNPFWASQYRPSLWKLVIVIPLREISLRLLRRLKAFRFNTDSAI